MLQSASDTADTSSNHIEEDVAEDFEVIIDEPRFCVVRSGRYYTGEVHTPCDLSELGWQLASYGYVMEEMIAFHDGVIEILLRPLGEIPIGTPDEERKILEDIAEYVKQKEGVYAGT